MGTRPIVESSSVPAMLGGAAACLEGYQKIKANAIGIRHALQTHYKFSKTIVNTVLGLAQNFPVGKLTKQAIYL